MLIRKHQKGDREQICKLFTQHTPYLRDTDFWLWVHRFWPSRDSIIYLAEEQGEVVGHYAVLPFELKVAQRRIQAGLGIHAFIAPDYRKKIPIFYLTRQCYQACKEEGIELLFGFPNANFRLIQEKVEGWKRVNDFLAWTRPLLPNTHPSLPPTLSLTPLDWQNSTHLAHLDDLFHLAPPPAQCVMQRSVSLWKRRFASHPQNTYQAFFVYEKASSCDFPISAFVLKEFTHPQSQQTIGHLMDYVSLPSLSPEDLLASSIAAFSQQVTSLAYWPMHPSMEKALHKQDFVPDGFSTFFAIKVLNEALKDEPLLYDKDMWFLPPSLSDAF